MITGLPLGGESQVGQEWSDHTKWTDKTTPRVGRSEGRAMEFTELWGQLRYDGGK